MTELLVVLGLIAGVVGAHEIGFWLGSLTRLKKGALHVIASQLWQNLIVFRTNDAMPESIDFVGIDKCNFDRVFSYT
jgi:hypothetical protein